MENNINILSIDGGGIRGILELVQLTELEKELNVPLREKFHYITGTSTGAIIAVLLSVGVRCSDILDIYINNANKIFKKQFLNFGLFRPKYDDVYLNEWLEFYTLDKTLADIEIDLLVPTYNISKREKYLYTTDKAKKNESDNFLLKDVIRSSAGAPLYFKPYQIKDQHFIDGGIVINNPSLMALLNVLEKNDINNSNSKINLLSFSGGQHSKNKRRNFFGGVINSIKSITQTMLEEQSKITHYTTQQIYELFKNMNNKELGKYTRCTSYIMKCSGNIDDVRPKNIKKLVSDGLTSYKYNKKKINSFIKHL